MNLSSKLYGLKFLHLISAYCINMSTTFYDNLKSHPSPKWVKEDFDLYFTGNGSGLFIWKKSNCILFNYNKFGANPVQKTIIRKAEQFSGLLSWCFVYFLIRKKQKQHFIHSQTDFCIVLGTILLHRAELCGSSSNQFSERLTTINSQCTFLHMLFGYFLLWFYRSLKHKIYGCR